MKKYDVIILGCGASGAMCALSAKSKNIAIIDNFLKPTKKILVTGNGRCNITNANMNSSFFNQNINSFLSRFSQKDALNFFEKLGLVCYADNEGRVYPISNSAKSVMDTINLSLNKKAELFLEHKVLNVVARNNKFVVETDKDIFECEKLVVATGGNSEILKCFDVCKKDFIPSLVALKSNDIKDLNGVKISNVKVTAKNSQGNSKSEVGEVLFKDGGLSGICVFNLSSLFSRINDFSGEIEIDLLPNMDYQQILDILEKRKHMFLKMTDFFTGLFLPSVANEIFRQAKTNINIKPDALTNEHISKLAKTIKCLKFNICGFFENNQVFSGGVCLEGLTNNLMSKKIKNLYFCGEICDVDGICGGYNLQWAWTSGHIVGESLW